MSKGRVAIWHPGQCPAGPVSNVSWSAFIFLLFIYSPSTTTYPTLRVRRTGAYPGFPVAEAEFTLKKPPLINSFNGIQNILATFEIQTLICLFVCLFDSQHVAIGWLANWLRPLMPSIWSMQVLLSHQHSRWLICDGAEWTDSSDSSRFCQWLNCVATFH